MEKVKAGVIGLGVIGDVHVKAMREEPGIEVVGLADAVAEKVEAKAKEYGVPGFASAAAMIETTRPDYVVVATPHYGHAENALAALERGVHALVEKPMTVHPSEARNLVSVARRRGLHLGVNFSSRPTALRRRLRDMLKQGFVGRVTHVTMVRTEWYRTMAYYRSGSWRGTWAGEGGGVTVNQSPHDLDLLCWTLGMPSEVLCEMNTSGHDIEVEDDVVALLKWPNGACGTLMVNTMDWPGRSLFEIVGTRGTLTMDGKEIRALSLKADSREHSDTTPQRAGRPEMAERTVWEPHDAANSYAVMNRNMAEAIREGRPLICSGEEALAEVDLSAALLVSGIKRKWVAPPVSDAEFEEVLNKLMELKNVAAAKAFFAR